MSKKDSIRVSGQVTEALGHDNYHVQLDNSIIIIATLSGHIRQNRIRVMVGDRVEVEMSPYDMTRGRISFRYKPNHQV